MKYAIIRSGGRQFRVVEGGAVEVDLMKVEDGAAYSFDDVLLIVNDGVATIGSPTIAGASVKATVEGLIKGPKLIAFRYKAKERQRRKRGHRQKYTRLHINTIEG